MARYDDNRPIGHVDDDYLCAECEQEYPRGDLAWRGDDLVCAYCEQALDIAAMGADFDDFVRGYLEAALFSTSVEEDFAAEWNKTTLCRTAQCRISGSA